MEPLSASLTEVRKGNGTHTATPTFGALALASATAFASLTASPSSVFIFQLPAMRGVRSAIIMPAARDGGALTRTPTCSAETTDTQRAQTIARAPTDMSPTGSGGNLCLRRLRKFSGHVAPPGALGPTCRFRTREDAGAAPGTQPSARAGGKAAAARLLLGL